MKPCIGKYIFYAIRWMAWLKTLMKGVTSYDMPRRDARSL